jgi:hypothetical protein
VGPRDGLDTGARGEILSPVLGIEPQLPSCPAHSQTLYVFMVWCLMNKLGMGDADMHLLLSGHRGRGTQMCLSNPSQFMLSLSSVDIRNYLYVWSASIIFHNLR